jgi:hypothetical protein
MGKRAMSKRYRKRSDVSYVILPGVGRVQDSRVLDYEGLARYCPTFLEEVEEEAPPPKRAPPSPEEPPEKKEEPPEKKEEATKVDRPAKRAPAKKKGGPKKRSEED